jgi:hypothetical protein
LPADQVPAMLRHNPFAEWVAACQTAVSLN